MRQESSPIDPEKKVRQNRVPLAPKRGAAEQMSHRPSKRTDDPLFPAFVPFCKFRGPTILYLSVDTAKPAVFRHLTDSLSAQLRKHPFFAK